MTEMSLAFGEEEVYSIDLSGKNAHHFVESILDNPHRLTIYNWKENARKMLWWLKMSQIVAK